MQKENTRAVLKRGGLPIELQEPHLEEDDGVLAGVLDEQLLEVGAARGQDELVRFERPGLRGQRHVHEKLLLNKQS